MIMDDFNVEDFDDFDLDEQEYKRAGSNCFRAPDNAVATDGGNVLSWSEIATVRKLVMLPWDGGAKAQAGDVTFVMDLQFKVSPESEFDDTESNNVGNILFNKTYFNLTAWKERPSDGHAKMTNGSIRRVKQLCAALGIENDYDGNPAKFISLHADDCVGETVRVMITQKENGEYGFQDEVKGIKQVEEDS